MKKLRMVVELEYEDEIMYDKDDPAAVEWFFSEIIFNDTEEGALILHSNEIGDSLGVVRVLQIQE